MRNGYKIGETLQKEPIYKIGKFFYIVKGEKRKRLIRVSKQKIEKYIYDKKYNIYMEKKIKILQVFYEDYKRFEKMRKILKTQNTMLFRLLIEFYLYYHSDLLQEIEEINKNGSDK